MFVKKQNQVCVCVFINYVEIKTFNNIHFRSIIININIQLSSLQLIYVYNYSKIVFLFGSTHQQEEL